MDKLKMMSMDKVQENVEKIRALFPNAVTEVIRDGKPTLAVDFDVLKQELADTLIDDRELRYQFTWPDKQKAILAANTPISKTLRPCKEESVDFDNTQNLYIEGDNLEVLKLLQETYHRKIKMIYIDPPYNTGKDFIYEDNFSKSAEDYTEVSGQYDEQGNRLVQNTESNGRFHTDWLNMIYPRLRMAKDLLSDDGVVFISIDDKEQANLKKVCDEIFGFDNYVGELILKTATDNNPSQINIEHEYMLCYAKSKMLQSNWLRTSEAAQRIIEQYNILLAKGLSVADIQKELRKWINANKDILPQVAHYNCVDKKGVYSCSSNSSNPHPGGYMYNIYHPITGKACPKPQNGWRWTEKTFIEYDKCGEIEWGVDETTQPHVKKRIETAVEYLRSLIYEDNRATTKLLADLFDGRKVFDNPKPVSVLIRLIDYTTNKDSIVLDFFSGSATTAHAVMQLNAEDGGNRKFIMVQLPEACDEKSEAYKAGYKNICEIGKERIRRAGRKIKEENGLTAQNLDVGFRVLKLDSSNMKDVYYNPEEYSQSLLDSLEDNIKSDRTPLDLLFQVMLELGKPLSAKIEERDIAGKKVFVVDDNDLIACFDSDITEETVKAIAKLQPLYAVFRDSSLSSDSTAANFEQIFATYSPNTVKKIL